MASAIYPKGKQNLLDGNIDMSSDTIKVAAIDTGTYTYNTAHDAYDDLSGVQGTPVTLTGKSLTDGVFDADDATFTSITGNTVEAVVIYKDSGTPSTSYLIAYLDSATAGLPFTPNGANVTLTWDSGANKIFKL